MRFSPVVQPIIALSLSVALVAGCSSSSTDTGNNTTACTVTLSGAVTATASCGSVVAAAYATASGTSAVAYSVSSPAISVAISFPGQVGSSTYSNTTSGASGGITLTQGSTVYYAVVAGGTSTGSFSLHITSVSTIASVSTGTSYTVHGTLTGTLVPASGSGTNVTLSSTF